jgi:hypothetical protein
MQTDFAAGVYLLAALTVNGEPGLLMSSSLAKPRYSKCARAKYPFEAVHSDTGALGNETTPRIVSSDTALPLWFPRVQTFC